MDDPTQDGKDLVLGLQAFLELDILIPEGMREKVKSDAIRTSLKESMKDWKSARCHKTGGVEGNGEC
jgi:hypothetical protein